MRKMLNFLHKYCMKYNSLKILWRVIYKLNYELVNCGFGNPTKHKTLKSTKISFLRHLKEEIFLNSYFLTAAYLNKF